MQITPPNAANSHITRFLFATIACLLPAGCAPMSFLITPVSSSRKLVETEVSRDGAWALRKIALIDVDGVLSNVRGGALLGGESDNPVSELKEKLDKAAGDKAVRAVVLRINSPGGGVTASDLMYDELRRFRESSGKPIVAAMLDVAASGGYYIACAADRIIAHPTTVTGSIGVIMITPDLSGTMSKIGIRANVIKSGEMKDAGSPFREMRPEDRVVFQKMINAMYERFLDVIVRGRAGLTRDQLRQIADGRTYTSEEAMSYKLIDQVGSLRDAIQSAKEAAGIGDSKVVVVRYHRPTGYRPTIYAQSPGGAREVNLINVNLPSWLTGDGGPQFMYLWAPGW